MKYYVSMCYYGYVTGEDNKSTPILGSDNTLPPYSASRGENLNLLSLKVNQTYLLAFSIDIKLFANYSRCITFLLR